jgi:hypothetical protein
MTSIPLPPQTYASKATFYLKNGNTVETNVGALQISSKEVSSKFYETFLRGSDIIRFGSLILKAEAIEAVKFE